MEEKEVRELGKLILAAVAAVVMELNLVLLLVEKEMMVVDLMVEAEMD